MTDSILAETLAALSEWSEGFALCFLFSSVVDVSGANADIIVCSQFESTSLLVDAVLDAAACASRAVVLDFQGCATPVVEAAFQRLNERRSRLEQMVWPLVVVCESDARLPLQYAAPDLWHIRTMMPRVERECSGSVPAR